MHKTFYTSGFLFHIESQQILLRQPLQIADSSSSLWSLFGGISAKEDDASVTFQNIIYKALGVKLAKKCIYPVYSYFHNVHNKMYHVYYGQVKKTKNFVFQGETLSWFTFKQTLKLRFSEETRQDIMVGQRVIDAAQRITAHTQYYPRAVPVSVFDIIPEDHSVPKHV